MNLVLDYTSGIPIYNQIVKYVKKQVVEGNLKENDMLPSVRGLAKELGVSTITIKRAYSELEKGGITYSVSGVGTFIRVNDTRALMEKNKQVYFEQLEEILKKLKINNCKKEEVLRMIDKFWE